MLDEVRAFRRSDWQFKPPCLLALIILFSLAALAQQGVPRLRVTQTASQSLTLIKPSDSNFDSTIESYFPGLSDEAGYQQAIRPFLALVRNDTGVTAADYAITWTVHYTDGFARPLRAIFVNRPLMYLPATTYIAPESIRLVSPLFNMTPEGYQANKQFAQEYPASHFPYSGRLASVEVGVDGVLYRDGSFIGPNSTHLLDRCAAAHFAARDEALAVLNFVNSSTAPEFVVIEQLQQILNQDIQREVRVHQQNLLARYVSARGQSAQDMLRILRNRGLSGTEALLQNFINRSGGNANPSSFGDAYRKLSNNDSRVFSITP